MTRSRDGQPRPPAADNTRFVLLGIGLLLGAILAVYWELSVDDLKTPRQAAATTRADASKKSGTSVNSRAPSPSARAPQRPPRRQPQPAQPAETNAIANKTPDREEPAKKRPGPLTTSSTPPRRTARLEPKPPETFDVRVDRVLIGGELITAGLFDESTVEQEQDHSKYFVCFELSWSALANAADIAPKCGDLRLEDARGQSYEPLCDLKGLRPATPQNGRNGLRVIFAVYNDSAPERLLYRTADGRFVPLSE